MRVGYKLNLTGPALTIQTTCSTSLVAVCMAVQSLITGACDLALAGGVSLNIPQKRGYIYHEGGILSPDGHCRTFDARARGTVFSSGIGIVVLRRLSDALADRDNIIAVIKGAAINNDGSQKLGYTAPSIEGQRQVIQQAIAAAGISPDQIGYVEAHGTGTELGDPIEVAALSEAFRSGTYKVNFCAIGSIKSNIGHLNTAAGVVGLINAAHVVKHGKLPPARHVETTNPKIDFDKSPFVVNRSLREWDTGTRKRIAGVSSFGVGGTNAHVIIEEPPAIPASHPTRKYQIIPLSARSEGALMTSVNQLKEVLERRPDLDIADIAFTFQVGRKEFAYRRAVAADTSEECLIRLHASTEAIRSRSGTNVSLLFPGQGSQSIGSTKLIYLQEPTFRSSFDYCAERFRSELDVDIRKVLYPDEKKREKAAHLLSTTLYAQPTLFTIGYSMARLWTSWGIQPSALLGHSIGEFVAGTISGVFALNETIKVVAARAKLMQAIPPGGMLSVLLPEEECLAICGPALGGVCIAAINSPDSCVLSGSPAAIAALADRFNGMGIGNHILETSHAFHSSMVDAIVEPLTRVVAECDLHEPKIPFLSNVTGDWISPSRAVDPNYWGEHARNTNCARSNQAI